MNHPLWLIAVVAVVAPSLASDASKAERGRDALLTRAFVHPIWSIRAFDNAWKSWGVAEKPADYDRAFRERYGLHSPPYPNGRFPMGLREADGILGKGLTNDCMMCHAGSIMGQSIVGLGNATLDLQSLHDDLNAADGRPHPTRFPFANVRGTTEAGAIAVYLLSLRDEQLNLRTPADFGLRADLCEDAPAWWLLKKKETIYHTGSTDARSVRTLMQFMLSPLVLPSSLKKQEPVFADIQSYLLSLEAPKYPLPIDAAKAEQGKGLFGQHCSRCHGTYGPDGEYPNKIIPLETIGTDPTRAYGFSAAVREHYRRSWFGQELGRDGKPFSLVDNRGYQAPPLDGVWATAPYFHNGSVPTIYHVLNSKARPRIFTRSYGTNVEEYDADKVGWKVQVLEGAPSDARPAYERRKIYDTTQPGRGNTGHTFGDKLSEDERRAVIEYLKTL